MLTAILGKLHLTCPCPDCLLLISDSLCLELAAFLGALLAGPLADKYSRKVHMIFFKSRDPCMSHRLIHAIQYSISVWCLVFMLGTALQAGATHNVGFIYGEGHAFMAKQASS